MRALRSLPLLLLFACTRPGLPSPAHDLATPPPPNSDAGPGAPGLWITAYYNAQKQAVMPASAIDFRAVTHVVHFALEPKPDGSLDAATKKVSDADAATLSAMGHAAGVKLLVCLGGASSAGVLRPIAADAMLAATLAKNLTAWVTAHGYDGVDIDWEPVDAADAVGFTTLTRALRSALDAVQPRPLLTVSTRSQPALFATLADAFDQINLRTYAFSELTAPAAWYDAPVFDGGERFPGGKVPPSADGLARSFIAAGVAPARLGIGVRFYGALWSGLSQPLATWPAATPPTLTELAYRDALAMQAPGRYHFDPAAQAAYLSDTTANFFLTYDDEAAIKDKLAYARATHLGGVIVWELAGAYDGTATPPDPLLQVIRAGR